MRPVGNGDAPRSFAGATRNVLRKIRLAPRSLTPLSESELTDLRHNYHRLSARGSNRILLLTFLSAVAFGAFVAFLTATPFGPLQVHRPDLRAAILGPSDLAEVTALVDDLLGAASVLFLVATVCSYTAVQRAVSLDAATIRVLEGEQGGTVGDSVRWRLRRADTMYRAAGRAVPCGIGCLLASVPLIGWRAHGVVALGMLGVLVFAGLVHLTGRIQDIRAAH